jgi:D-alanyl-D-alanine carboxypeptidase (penicillin-binding protein 5/6)
MRAAVPAAPLPFGIAKARGDRYGRRLFMPLHRLVSSAVFALTLAFAFSPAKSRADSLAYVVADSTTGFILDQYNAQKKLQIGSLTKIATAMVVLDWAAASNADLSQLATVPESIAQLGPQQGVGFQPGDTCALRDLLYAAMMQSDNVAALTLAEHVGRALPGDLPPVDRFVQQMNALAKAKGMTRTRFLNPHGLDSLEKTLPYSTAEDLAKLTAYAEANSAFRFYGSQKERKITYTGASGSVNYLLRNTNELLGQYDIDGVKTGTTQRAGQCIIVSAAKAPESVQKGEMHYITPRRLIVVVLGSNDRFREAAGRLQEGWRYHEAWAAAGRPMKGWKPPR